LRLYSSGPGIYIGLVIGKLFGIRRSFGAVVIDPVLPRSLDGAQLDLDWSGRKVRWVFHVDRSADSPASVEVNGARVEGSTRLRNAYRDGGVSIDAEVFASMLSKRENTVDVYR